MPYESTLLTKTLRLFVNSITLTAIMITFNSCAVSIKVFQKYLKNDPEMKTRDPANDGLLNQLFLADASKDRKTLTQEFNLLKHVNPNIKILPEFA